jgi:Ni/Co efflux regulator RcnB
MLKKVLVTLIASAFTATVFAQAQSAQPTDPKAQTSAATHKASKKNSTTKTAKAKTKAKAKAKNDQKTEAGK